MLPTIIAVLMPIPQLDNDGLLPPGLHNCTLDEVQERFGRFQTSSHRCRLHEQFETYLKEVKSTGLIVAMIVNGSFVTDKAEPNDIDVVLILAAGHDFSAELRPFEYNVLSRRQVRRQHGFDVLLAVEGQPELENAIEFFAQVRDQPSLRKGLLKVTL